MRYLAFLLVLGGWLLAWGEEPLPTAVELIAMDRSAREAAVERLCREAGPAQWETLLELAKQPELVGHQLGALGEAMYRTVSRERLSDADVLLASPSPSSQFLGAMLLRPRWANAIDRRRQLVAAKDVPPAVRSWAMLESWAEHLPYAGGHPHACQMGVCEATGGTAAARACAVEASTWCNPWAFEGRLVSKTDSLDLRGEAQVCWVEAGNKYDRRGWSPERLKEWLKGNRTLYLMVDGEPPEWVDRVLTGLGLPVPQITRGSTVYVANLAEPHPLLNKVYLLSDLMVHQPQWSSQAAGIAPALATVSVPGWWALTGWDPQVWAAPFVGLGQPERACWLESPPTAERGRVVIDVTGARYEQGRFDFSTGCIRSYEAAVNLRAHLLGVGAVPPVKEFYDTRGEVDFRLPHPYYPLTEAVPTPHATWGTGKQTVSVVFCLPDIMARTGIELKQRLPGMAATYLPFTVHTFDAPRGKPRLGPPVLDGGAVAALKRLELHTGHCDVLVLPALEGYYLRHAYELTWRQVPGDLQAAILQAVRDGMELVFVGPSFDPAWLGAMPLEAEEPPEWLTGTMPVPREQATQLVAGWKLGQGRIVQVKIPMLNGTAPVALDDGFVVPGLNAPATMRVRADEYGFSLAAASLFWRDGHELAISEPVREEFVDAFGAGRFKQPPGPAIRHVWYANGWGAERVGPKAGNPPMVTFARQVVELGAELSVTVGGDGDRVVVEVLDHLGRLRRQAKALLTNGKASLTLPGWTPLARWHDLRVTVWKGGDVTQYGVAPFAVNVKRDRHDAQWWVTPAPVSFGPALKAVGVTGVNSGREYPLPWLDRNDPRWQEAYLWNHWEASLRNGFDLMQQGVGVTVDVTDPGRTGEMPVSLADPAFWGRLRERLLTNGPRWNVLGVSHFNLADEFALPPTLDRGPVTLMGFRNWVLAEYGGMEQLEAGWGRRMGGVQWIRPDDLRAALNQGNLGPWATHRAYMESLVTHWRDESERLLRESIADAQVDMSNCREGPDTGVDMAALLRAGGWNTQYAGQDTIRKRDLRRPDTDLGIWLPFNLGRKLEPDEALEARCVSHQFLLDGFRDDMTWWGFEDFGWPLLRPDFAPCRQFRAMSEEFGRISHGIDRLVLGAERDNRQVAGLFSQACWRTTHALNTGFDGKLPLCHDWQLAAELAAPAGVRGHVIRPEDLATLDPAETPLLVLFGAVALPPESAAQLRRYVEAGGFALADIVPGAYDEHGVRQDVSAMAALFGVSWDGKLADPGKSRPVRPSGPWRGFMGEKTTMLAEKLRVLDDPDGRYRGFVDPTWIYHTVGKGRTVLLNVAPRPWLAIDGSPGNRLTLPRNAEYRDSGRYPWVWWSLAEAMVKRAQMRPSVKVTSDDRGYPAPDDVTVFRDGEALIVGVLNMSYDPSATDRQVKLKTELPMALYTVGGELQPAATMHSVTVPHHTAGYFVLTAEPLPPLTASAASVDGELAVTVKGGAQRRVVLVEVSAPDGTRRPELDGEAEVRGEAVIRVATALSDPAGTWRMAVRDIVTGQRLELEVAR